jgi:hypothetical protein
MGCSQEKWPKRTHELYGYGLARRGVAQMYVGRYRSSVPASGTRDHRLRDHLFSFVCCPRVETGLAAAANRCRFEFRSTDRGCSCAKAFTETHPGVRLVSRPEFACSQNWALRVGRFSWLSPLYASIAFWHAARAGRAEPRPLTSQDCLLRA